MTPGEQCATRLHKTATSLSQASQVRMSPLTEKKITIGWCLDTYTRWTSIKAASQPTDHGYIPDFTSAFPTSAGLRTILDWTALTCTPGHDLQRGFLQSASWTKSRLAAISAYPSHPGGALIEVHTSHGLFPEQRVGLPS
jgi:hypothetical protein